MEKYWRFNMQPKTILEEAILTIENREYSHGNYEENLKTAADLFSVYLNKNIMPADVCVLLTLLKISRIKCGEPKKDHFVDICGYTALAASLSGVEK